MRLCSRVSSRQQTQAACSLQQAKAAYSGSSRAIDSPLQATQAMAEAAISLAVGSSNGSSSGSSPLSLSLLSLYFAVCPQADAVSCYRLLLLPLMLLMLLLLLPPCPQADKMSWLTTPGSMKPKYGIYFLRCLPRFKSASKRAFSGPFSGPFGPAAAEATSSCCSSCFFQNGRESPSVPEYYY